MLLKPFLAKQIRLHALYLAFKLHFKASRKIHILSFFGAFSTTLRRANILIPIFES